MQSRSGIEQVRDQFQILRGLGIDEERSCANQSDGVITRAQLLTFCYLPRDPLAARRK